MAMTPETEKSWLTFVKLLEASDALKSAHEALDYWCRRAAELEQQLTKAEAELKDRRARMEGMYEEKARSNPWFGLVLDSRAQQREVLP